MEKNPSAIISIFIFCVVTLIPFQVNAESSIRMQIDSALMGLKPLDTIRSVSRLPISKLKLEGVSIEENNDNGYDEVIHIKFDPAFIFHGVSTQEITLSFETPYSNFYALVYGVFAGDINSFVKELDLKIGTPRNTPAIGKYNRPLSDTKGCPITLGASPIDNDHFVFGSGWCNGD